MSLIASVTELQPNFLSYCIQAIEKRVSFSLHFILAIKYVIIWKLCDITVHDLSSACLKPSGAVVSHIIMLSWHRCVVILMYADIIISSNVT
jgi:hypothetical protein